jgi:hypothetical protein
MLQSGSQNVTDSISQCETSTMIIDKMKTSFREEEHSNGSNRIDYSSPYMTKKIFGRPKVKRNMTQAF